MTDDLDHRTDADLNEIFATEVDSWQYVTISAREKREGKRALLSKPGVPGFCVIWKDGQMGGTSIPNYCADTDALIPFLEKLGFWNSAFTSNTGEAPRHRVTLGFRDEFDGYASVFPRAAALALIRAKRATEGAK